MEIAGVPAISYFILSLKISPVLPSYEVINCFYKGYKPSLGNTFLKAKFFGFDQDYNVYMLCFLTSLLAYFLTEKQITNFLPSSS